MVLSLEIQWHLIKYKSWWRNQMETFSALLVICAGNSTVTGHEASVQLHAASELWGTITTVNLQCVSYGDTAVCTKPSKYILSNLARDTLVYFPSNHACYTRIYSTVNDVFVSIHYLTFHEMKTLSASLSLLWEESTTGYWIPFTKDKQYGSWILLMLRIELTYQLSKFSFSRNFHVLLSW